MKPTVSHFAAVAGLTVWSAVFVDRELVVVVGSGAGSTVVEVLVRSAAVGFMATRLSLPHAADAVINNATNAKAAALTDANLFDSDGVMTHSTSRRPNTFQEISSEGSVATGRQR